MKRNLYFYRGCTILRCNQKGWTVGLLDDFNIYRTVNSAREAINKHLDSSNKIDPVIIGKIDFSEYDEQNKKVNYIYF